ncbi:hypothetical protein HSBAA_35810 [Vreelandella sulfidaeris]|uniref:Cytochrome ubiquinol oxidase subunit I n=1 Tax=Vreelandella sulfidaeris TaxID=115553 RepID=A0A455U8H6_9GAMM|nr:hypothetical protein HSBAA_35810 [Halomonas sulfidaeris]
MPLLLFAIPDQEAQTNHFSFGVPNLASLILTHSVDGEIPGISEAPPEEQPPVFIVFWAFRVMVGIGLLMIAVSLTGLILRRKGRIYTQRLFLKTMTRMIAVPFVAVLAGWVVTESGRAPWLVYGMMTHEEGLTPSLTGPMALFTLLGYILVYAVVFYVGIYYLTRVVRNGMLPEEKRETEADNSRRPMRPMSGAETSFDDDLDPVRN